ncbi:hypothetical protein TNCV_4850791 [Trichonephila clavipes]|nr:hypothetical protein TNCV_4850791 [Trichonephila clavipes]
MDFLMASLGHQSLTSTELGRVDGEMASPVDHKIIKMLLCWMNLEEVAWCIFYWDISQTNLLFTLKVINGIDIIPIDFPPHPRHRIMKVALLTDFE